MTKKDELLQQSLVAIGLSLAFITDEKILKICNKSIDDISQEIKNLDYAHD